MNKRHIESFARITRCKDCKHSGEPSAQVKRYGVKGAMRCNNGNAPCNARLVKAEDYCSYGEQREE